MAIELNKLQAMLAKKEDFARPPIILMFGVEGWGKTTFSSRSPKPVFIPVEDGFGDLCEQIGETFDAFPVPKTYEEMMGQMEILSSSPPQHKTLVIETMDRVEQIIWNKVLVDNGIEALGNLNWGAGFVQVNKLWEEFFAGVKWINANLNMMVILTAHTEVKKTSLPDSTSFDEYAIDLHKDAKAMLMGQCDCIFFANYKKPHVTVEKDGFKEEKKAIGSTDRMLHMQKTATSFGKNRYHLPPFIKVEDDVDGAWGVIASHVPWFKQFGEVAKPEQKVVAEPVVAEKPAEPEAATPKFLQKKS